MSVRNNIPISMSDREMYNSWRSCTSTERSQNEKAGFLLSWFFSSQNYRNVLRCGWPKYWSILNNQTPNLNPTITNYAWSVNCFGKFNLGEYNKISLFLRDSVEATMWPIQWSRIYETSGNGNTFGKVRTAWSSFGIVHLRMIEKVYWKKKKIIKE